MYGFGVRRLLLATIALALTVACSSTSAAAPTAPPKPTASPASPAATSQPTAVASAANPYLARPGEQPVPVKAAWCAISAGFVQMFVARDYHLFEPYGLSLESSQFTDSQAALAALQSGEIDFLFCAAAATIPGMASGVDATLVAAPLVGLPYVMVARPDLKSVQDLGGKKVGINRQGDLDDRLSHAVLQQEHVPADSVQFVPAGGQTERYRAVLSGIIDAALDSAYQAYAQDYVNRSVDVPMAAVQDSIDYARDQGTNIARGKAADIVDGRFAADLQTTGFLQAQWGHPIPPSQ